MDTNQVAYLPKQNAANKNKKWFEQTALYYLQASGCLNGLVSRDIDKLFNMLTTNISEDVRDIVAKPFSPDVESILAEKFIGRYPIVTPIFNTFVGETLSYPNNYDAVAVNPGAVSEREEMLSQAMSLEIDKAMAAYLKGKPEEAPNLEKKKRELVENLKDKGTLAASEILKALESSAELYEAEHGFILNAFTCSTGVIFVNTETNLTVENVDPRNFYFIPSTISNRIEDSFCCIRKMELFPAEIAGKFLGLLETSDYKDLQEMESNLFNGDQRAYYGTANIKSLALVLNSEDGSVKYNFSAGQRYDVFHICFIGYDKQKFVKTVNEFGQINTMVLPKDYKRTSRDIAVETIDVPAIYETYAINADELIIFGYKRHKVQTNIPLSIGVTKMPYFGRSDYMSIPKLCETYLKTHDILKFKFLVAINKLNSFIILPDDVRPANMYREAWLEYARIQGIMHASVSSHSLQYVNAIRAVDTASAQEIQVLLEAMTSNINEMYQNVQYSSIRGGQATQYTGKAVAEIAAGQSTAGLISNTLFFDDFKVQLRMYLLEAAKYMLALGEAQELLFLISRQTREFLLKDMSTPFTLKFSLKIINSAENQAQMQMIMNYVVAPLLNGNPDPGVALQIIDNLSAGGSNQRLKMLLETYVSSQQQSAQENQQKQLQIVEDEKKTKLQIEIEALKIQRDKLANDVEKAKIMADSGVTIARIDADSSERIADINARNRNNNK